MKHDELCRGCEMNRRRAVSGVGAKMHPPEYKTNCSQCGVEIPGEYEHFVRGKIYCSECAPDE